MPPTDPLPEPELPAEAVAALRDALREALRARVEPGAADSELRAALTRVAHEARERKIPPEQLLIQLHRAWDDLLPPPDPNRSGERQRLLTRIVALCLDQYFALGLVAYVAAGLLRKVAH